MSHRLAPSRRRRLSLEACEPRAMLSTVPVATPQTELADEMPALYTIDGTDTWVPGSFVSISTTFGGITLSNDFGSAGLNAVTRGYVQGLPATDGAFAIPNGMPWGGIRSPMLDPIAFPIPGLPAPESPSSDEGLAPTKTQPAAPIAAPSPIAAPLPPVSLRPVSMPSPTADAPLRLPSSPTAREPAGERAASSVLASLPAEKAGIEPRWLPATFSPAEQHRTETLALAAHGEPASEARLARSRTALQPTRVTCQAFCDVAPARTSPRAPGAEHPSVSVREQDSANADDRQAAARCYDEARAEPPVETVLRAVRDAAILEWEAPRGSSGEAPSPAGCCPQGDAVPATSPLDAVAAPAGDDEPEPGQSASVWDSEGRFVVPLAVAVATSAVLCDRLGETEETGSAAPIASLLRRAMLLRRP